MTPRHTLAMTPRRIFAAAAAIGLALSLSACATPDPLATLATTAPGSDFSAGELRVVEIPASDRGEPVDFSGTSETGTTLAGADYRGQVLVVNFWYAACGPCRAEAPLLQQAYEELSPKGVEFLGVNVYDQPATSQAFADSFDISYPSIIAADDGEVKFDFAKVTPVTATPTTLILDRTGRVAARIIGEIPDTSVLTAVAAAVAAEPA